LSKKTGHRRERKVYDGRGYLPGLFEDQSHSFMIGWSADEQGMPSTVLHRHNRFGEISR
jgi:hypothetical protein